MTQGRPEASSVGEELTRPVAARTDGSEPFDAVVSLIGGIGGLVRFSWELLCDVPRAVRLFPAEIMRHIGALIRENALLAIAMLFIYGVVFAVTYDSLFDKIGINSLISAAHAVGTLRGVGEVIFGWVIAAKVGCGIVAELGAMRISDEIDAMEVMAIDPVPYLASTRLIAGAVVFPLLWTIAYGIEAVAGYLINVLMIKSSSAGAFTYFYFLFQNPFSFFAGVIWSTIVALFIVMASCYYGYHAHGGAVGVGRATAQSMVVNVVMTSVFAMILVQLFYGSNPTAPVGN